MKTRFRLFATVVLFCALLVSPAFWGQSHALAAEEARGDIVFSGPYEVGRLSVWMMQSKDATDVDDYLSLNEAVKAGVLVVHETENVGSLTVENRSPNKAVLILSGEIVKGGKQDRTLGSDMLVPPKSGKLPIESFCVEQSRWAKRGSEAATEFSSAGKRSVGKEMRSALRYEKSQGKVWSGVASNQDKLSANLKAEVKDVASPTSMQLTLENKKVQNTIKEYREALGDLLAKHPNANGFAFLVNGGFSSAELLHSRAFFKKAFPAMLEAAIVEAVSEEHLEKKAGDDSWMRMISTQEKPERLEEQKGPAGVFHRTSVYKTHYRYDFLKDGVALHTTWDDRLPDSKMKPTPNNGPRPRPRR